MEVLRCEILVVGAGPAGASAAWAAAAAGRDVLVVERRRTIGVPVQCAEFVPAALFGEIGPVEEAVVQSVDRMHTILPDGDRTVTRSPGRMVRRDRFDQCLARAAAAAGARVLTSTQALARSGQGSVIVQRCGGRGGAEVRARVIVGADGPRSRVARWIGSENRCRIQAMQWTVPLARPMAHTEVYFHKEFYGGYGWLFPKGREANVGLGRRRRSDRDEPIGRILARFVARLAREGKIDPTPSRTTAGWIPAGPVRKVVAGNVLLVGDAAGHTHPVTGAGVPQAVLGGRMAGTWAARAVEEGDTRLLNAYEEEWRERFGPVQERAYARRKELEAGWGRLEMAVRRSWIAFREYYASE